MGVEVLDQGYNTFRTWMLMELGLDINTTLTIPSLARQFFIKAECYTNAYKLGGAPQMFIQRSVIGGHTCAMIIKKLKFDKPIGKRMNAFDAVLLYATAMNRLPGFLKGVPKVLTVFNCDNIEGLDGYFVYVKFLK